MANLNYNGTGAIPQMRWQLPVGKTVTIDWGDLSPTTDVVGTGLSDVLINHTYGSSDNWIVTFTGDVGDVTKLEWINDSNIEGDISNLSSMISLTYLRLNNTSVGGDIVNLSGLTSLVTLFLNNTLIDGDIANLSGLTSLADLLLYTTAIEGDIANLSGLTSLVLLYLRNTSVEGDISNLSNLTSLTALFLNNTLVEGDISNLSGLTSLTSLSLYNTSGDITYISSVTIPISWKTIDIDDTNIPQIDLHIFINDLYTNKEARPVSGVFDCSGCAGIVPYYANQLDWFTVNKSWTVSYETAGRNKSAGGHPLTIGVGISI